MKNNYEKIKPIARMSSCIVFSSCLNFLHNYFDGPTKLFSDLYLFLHTSTKSFFPCVIREVNS